MEAREPQLWWESPRKGRPSLVSHTLEPWRGQGPREGARGRKRPCPQGSDLVQQDQRSFPSEAHSHKGGSPQKPKAGPYLMELSDETSRAESSVSLGGGGGSLSGTAVKAGDFRSPD